MGWYDYLEDAAQLKHPELFGRGWSMLADISTVLLSSFPPLRSDGFRISNFFLFSIIFEIIKFIPFFTFIPDLAEVLNHPIKLFSWQNSSNCVSSTCRFFGFSSIRLLDQKTRYLLTQCSFLPPVILPKSLRVIYHLPTYPITQSRGIHVRCNWCSQEAK